ncbi:MAG: cell division protein FtsL [Betaproteobacteria bacterium]|nr:cell division protein FtsL [Betaproteobacteria bacterium]
MLRFSMILLVLVLTSALGVVAAQHQSRKLFTELEREQSRMRALEVEWGQLQLEQSTWAGHARVEKAARERLRMISPTQIVVLDSAGGAR